MNQYDNECGDYYKCVNTIRVWITGVQTSSVLTWKCFAKNQPGRRGSAPYRRSDWTSRLWGRPNRTVEKTRRVRVLFSLPSCNSLVLLNSARLNARKADLEAGPPDSLSTKPTIGGGLRLCQSRNGATKSTIAEESFPRWRHAAISSLHTRTTEGARAEHVTPETKNSRGKTNQLRACFKTHPSKYKLNS